MILLNDIVSQINLILSLQIKIINVYKKILKTLIHYFKIFS